MKEDDLTKTYNRVGGQVVFLFLDYRGGHADTQKYRQTELPITVQPGQWPGLEKMLFTSLKKSHALAATFGEKN